MPVDFPQFGLILMVAASVALLCERLKLPYTVGLVLAGLALAISPVVITLPLSKSVIYTLLLPPLVFEAALRLRWVRLRAEMPIILALTLPGFAIAVGITAAGMSAFAGWSWAGALLFGILIAATDPVSVIATFDEAGVRGRIDLLVRSESLLNDGVAAVAFGLVLAYLAGQAGGAVDIGVAVTRTVGGGVAIGVGIAAALLFVAKNTENHLVELTLTTLAAYGSFLVAEHFHASGVLASLSAGLVVGAGGRIGTITAVGRDAVSVFWEFAAFLTNSLIFILIGVREAHQDFRPVLGVALLALVLVLVSRAATIYPIAWLFRRTRAAVAVAHQHVLFWGGLRGALALALALGLPASIPERDTIVKATFLIVAFSVFVQTLTMVPLLRRLGIIGDDSETKQA